MIFKKYWKIVNLVSWVSKIEVIGNYFELRLKLFCLFLKFYNFQKR